MNKISSGPPAPGFSPKYDIPRMGLRVSEKQLTEPINRQLFHAKEKTLHFFLDSRKKYEMCPA